MMMNKRVAVAAVALLLSGCMSGPVAVVYRTGSTFAERQSVADQCRIDSIDRIPQVIVTDYEPPVYRPGFTECKDDNGRRYCREVGGFTYPGSSRSRDVNQDLRERYIASCLRASGYQVIVKPICGGSAEDAYLAGRDNQPPAETLACVSDDERVIPKSWH